MNKKIVALISLLVILTFIGYIVYDTATDGKVSAPSVTLSADTSYSDMWTVSETHFSEDGSLTSVAVSESGRVYLGGDSYIKCLDPELSEVWKTNTESKITSVSLSGDTIYAATVETILLFDINGKMLAEWGPYEANSIITSISAGRDLVAFGDAGSKRVFILMKNGEVISMMGQSDKEFIIPSAYFDVVMGEDNKVYVANTGHRRVETWTAEGSLLGSFGEPGTAPGAFCGCCNPAHFTVVPQGFITAEKGINRIKILDKDGTFIEYVSSKNDFMSSIPLDIASLDGVTIYAANPADSKLYVFKRK